MNKLKEIKRTILWKRHRAVSKLPEGRIKNVIYDYSDKNHMKNEVNNVIAGLPENYNTFIDYVKNNPWKNSNE